MLPRAIPFIALVLAAGPGPALAQGMDQDQAKKRIEAAGYGGVGGVHQGNLGEWMAEAEKDGHHVLVVVHADGSVDRRQEVEVAPVHLEPMPAPSAMGKP